MVDPYLQSLLGNNEQILLVARRHWLVLAGEIASEVSLCIAWIVLISMLLSMLLNPLLALGYLLLVLPLISLTRDVLAWRNHRYIVTNRRVMQTAGVWNRSVIDSSLEKVNDVKMEQSAFGRLLGYGDIAILTASELGVNKFTQLAQPVAFKTAMLNAREQMSQPPAGRAVKNEVGLLSALEELRRNGVLTPAEFEQKKAEILKRI